MRDDIVIVGEINNIVIGTVTASGGSGGSGSSSLSDSVVNKSPVHTWTFSSLTSGA